MFANKKCPVSCMPCDVVLVAFRCYVWFGVFPLLSICRHPPLCMCVLRISMLRYIACMCMVTFCKSVCVCVIGLFVCFCIIQVVDIWVHFGAC